MIINKIYYFILNNNKKYKWFPIKKKCYIHSKEKNFQKITKYSFLTSYNLFFYKYYSLNINSLQRNARNNVFEEMEEEEDLTLDSILIKKSFDFKEFMEEIKDNLALQNPKQLPKKKNNNYLEEMWNKYKLFEKKNFKECKEHISTIYNSMIFMFASNGQYKKVIELYKNMLDFKIEPNRKTFNSLILVFFLNKK